MIKGIAIPGSLDTGAFSFQFPDKRGFQIGDTSKTRRIFLEVFDSSGRCVEILCGTDPQRVRVTQAELNRIVRSLHTVPPNSVPVNTARESLQN
jgi:hypothetical protein